jgi:hypothetical protein
MNVLEMKKTIHEKVEKLETSAELAYVLDVINRFEEKKRKSSDIESIFVIAKEKYGPVLKKLAE